MARGGIQKAGRTRLPQLPSEIWSNIARRLYTKDRLRGFDLVCREFHCLPWDCVNIYFRCQGDNYDMADIEPPLPWVMAVWPRIQSLAVRFVQRDDSDEPELQDATGIVHVLRAARDRWAGKPSPTSLSFSMFLGWRCPVPSNFLQACLSVMPNLAYLNVSGGFLYAMPALRNLQELRLSVGKYPDHVLEGLRHCHRFRRLSLLGYSGEGGALAVGSFLFEQLYHLEQVNLRNLIPDKICLPPSCELHLDLPSSALTSELECRLKDIHLTRLEITETACTPLQQVLCQRLGRVGSLQEVSVMFQSKEPEQQRSHRHAPTGTVLCLTGPLLQHCTVLDVGIRSNLSLWVPSHMQLSSLTLWADCCHPRMIDAEDLSALGESLREVDIFLSTAEGRGYKKGTRPAWCRRLLAAASQAEKRFFS